MLPLAHRAKGPEDRAISVIVPIFNEGLSLCGFHTKLKAVLETVPYKHRILYVNDGSTDQTLAILKHIHASDQNVDYLSFSRNFGHQAALTAGLQHVGNNIVVMMDGDGQHPPELISEMLRLYEDGYDIVQTQRVDLAQPGSRWKRMTSHGFYWIVSQVGEVKLLPGSADFRLISKDVVNALRSMKEYHRFLRGMTSWLGFRTIILPYQPSQRIAGETKYSIRKMLRLATDGLFSFSLMPLRFGIAAGCLFLLLTFAELSYVMSLWLFRGADKLVPGWSSLILMVTIGNGITMMLLGFLGIYIGMIFQEVKRRPVYIIDRSASSKETLLADSAPENLG